MKKRVEAQVETDRCGNSSDYVRDLVRRDQERAEAQQCGFAQSEIYELHLVDMPDMLAANPYLAAERYAARVLQGLQNWFEQL